MIMTTKLFLTGLALIAITTILNGQNADAKDKQQIPTGKGVYFIDKDQDGVCDNFESRKGKAQNTQGKCINKGGRAYGNGRGNCCGRGPCNGQGQGRGRNFVDKNEDGVCDNFKDSPQNQ